MRLNLQPIFRSKLAYASILSVSISLGAAAANQNTEFNSLTKKEEVFIEAAQLDYDYENSLVIAQGKVEVMKGQYVLFADQIVYNQNDNTVTANGNVVAVGADNLAIFSDSFTLADDLKNGVITYFRARLDDGSLLAAAEAKRINASKIELTKAVYSPCPVCTVENPEDAPNAADPQWQLKADKVTVDDIKETVSYEDAYLEVYGTPVIYTPYFSHPTPNAKKKSGFLAPNGGSDANLGLMLS